MTTLNELGGFLAILIGAIAFLWIVFVSSRLVHGHDDKTRLNRAVLHELPGWKIFWWALAVVAFCLAPYFIEVIVKARW